MKEKVIDINAIEEALQKAMSEKAETEMDIHRGELMVKQIKAYTDLKKYDLELMKLQMEQKRVELEERRLFLDEISAKFNMSSELAKRSDKIQRAIGKLMVGLFPEQDKQVAKILEATKAIEKMS